jgi:signal transduction histidine kinase
MPCLCRRGYFRLLIYQKKIRFLQGLSIDVIEEYNKRKSEYDIICIFTYKKLIFHRITIIDLIESQMAGKIFVGGIAMPIRTFRLAVAILSVITHLVALVQYRLDFSGATVPERWFVQFCILLAISASGSLVLLINLKRTVVWGVFLGKALILVLISLPLGKNIGADLTVLTTVLLEVGMSFSLTVSLCYNCSLSLLLIYIHSHQVRVWEGIAGTLSLHDALFFFIYSGILIMISAYLPYQEKHRFSAAELNRRLDEATLRLTDTNLKLQEYAAIVERETIQNERKRMAREMHDTLAYTLTNLVMMIDAGIGLAVTDSTKLVKHLSQIRLKTQEGLVEVRRTLQSLRPVELVKVQGLHAIRYLVTAFANATKIEMTLNLGNAPLFFEEETGLVAYRLVQEGITNALRHGKATSITVSLGEVDGNLTIQIKDNGVGITEFKEGLGLVGMRERIEKLGGKLSVVSQPGNGFILNALIPLEKGSGPNVNH